MKYLTTKHMHNNNYIIIIIIMVLDTEFNSKIKYKQLEKWQYQHLDIALEVLIGAKKKCENCIRKQENC
jgi:hypothetical protein